MACSCHARSSMSINLFNLPSLPDERRKTTMICKFPNNSLLPDRKNSRLSQIVNKGIFSRQTLDGNEGVMVKITYLECAYSTKYYLIDQINEHINAIHDNIIKPTEFVGHFSPFNLNELELKVCRIADCCKYGDDSMLDDERRHTIPDAPDPQKPSQPRKLCSFKELRNLVHDGKVFTTEQHKNQYFAVLK